MNADFAAAEKKTFSRRVKKFLSADHRYVFLGTSALAYFAFALLQGAPSRYSFLAVPALDLAANAVLGAWFVFAAAALVTKLTHWAPERYAATWACTDRMRKIEKTCAYIVWALVALVVLDRAVLGFVAMAQDAAAAPTAPDGFVESAIYMMAASQSMYVRGISTTIELAVFGTVIAFFLALLMVFLRIQTPNRKDNDFVKFLKIVGSGFASLYSTVVRGTPMMVQGLIIYTGGFLAFKSTGMTTTEVTHVWTTFIAGLVIISLNSTAYIMEVLRGGIEAVDPGQTEAARSLGLSQWQAMTKVVFPQGVRNAIPALSNEVVINIKDSSVLSVVGVFDLMFATTSVVGIYYKQMPAYILAALIYLLLTYVATRLLARLSRALTAKAPEAVPSSN